MRMSGTELAYGAMWMSVTELLYGAMLMSGTELAYGGYQPQRWVRPGDPSEVFPTPLQYAYSPPYYSTRAPYAITVRYAYSLRSDSARY
eukprot:2756443-Rhodomonas_salina.2